MTDTYSISQVEILSGIKSHTLRIWEKRYGIIEPKRTDTNIRYFDKCDLKKILNIAYLNKLGYKISKISEFNENELNSEVVNQYAKDNSTSLIVELLLADVIDYNLYSFKNKIQVFLKKKAFNALVTEVIYPLFDKLGVLWHTSLICPAQEHLFSNYIRQVICGQIDAVVKQPHKEKVLLFLREGEYHELGLLIYSYVLVNKGYEVYYLGQSVPFEDFVHAYKAIKPTKIVTTFLAYLEKQDFNTFIEGLLLNVNPADLFLTGDVNFLEDNKANHNYKIIKNINDFKNHF